jgi:serine/threonine protein kinase
MTSEIICPHCGQPHRSTAKFCNATGKLISPAGVGPAPVGAPGIGPATPPAPASAEASVAARSGPQAGLSGSTSSAMGSQAGLTGRLPPNSMLHNRYLILQKIGQGGMAAVYKVTDTVQGGAIWAVKEMSDAAILNQQDRTYALKSFQQEGSLLQSLNHPNLMKVSDIFCETGKYYLLMEFIPGSTLEAMIAARGRFSEPEVLPWALQLCDVLDYLHNHVPPIIFRDLKPGNIMITPTGQVKLIDFGIVRFFKPGKTKDTQALGTPGYCAPEATTGQTDARSDIYSLSVTLHQLLTGYDPGTSLFSLPPARQLNPSVSEGMAEIISRGVQLRREERWSSAGEMRLALLHLAYGEVAINTGVMVSSANGTGTQKAIPSGVAAQSSIPITPATSRPTTRLLMAAARLSSRQMALIVGGAALFIVVLAMLLTRPLAELGYNWNTIPIMAIFGAIGYAAYPRRGSAFISNTLLTIAMVAAIWTRLDYVPYPWATLFLGAILSGIFMEVWVTFLPRIKGPGSSSETWPRELVWLIGMAVIGTSLFLGFTTGWKEGLRPVQWVICAILGALGWFLGDMFQQYLLYKQTGFRRAP